MMKSAIGFESVAALPASWRQGGFCFVLLLVVVSCSNGGTDAQNSNDTETMIDSDTGTTAETDSGSTAASGTETAGEDTATTDTATTDTATTDTATTDTMDSDSAAGTDTDTGATFLPIDSDGWTMFTPSDDTRILYISENGDDSIGSIYTAADMTNPFEPDDPVNAFATYKAAFEHTRDGYPDWILYERGGTFYDAPSSNLRSGRGPNEPFLIGSYGSGDASPLIKTGADAALIISKTSPGTPGTFEYIAVQGLRFYAHHRNPDDSDFAGYGEAGHGINISTYNADNIVRNILVEGCGLSHYKTNIVVQAAGDAGSVSDIEIRRNTIVHAYSVDSHAQGLYASGVESLLIEENVFDHNGWLIQASGNDRTNGGATFHNHNVYTDGVQNGTYRNNIFTRASSIGTKLQGNAGIDGMVVDNNLYIDGEIGIESCNNYHDNFFRVHQPIVANNVFYELGRSNPTLRDVGWGMWIQGWDGGRVNNNLLIGHQGQMFFNLGLRSRGIEIDHNIGLLTSMYGVYQNSEVALTDIHIHDNYFEKLNVENDRVVLTDGAAIDGIQFENNQYFSPGPLEFRINGTSYDANQWLADFESEAQLSQRTFPDRERTIESYMASIGETATLDRFIELCRMQERYHWDDRIVATTVNDWLRAGFDMHRD